MHKIHFIGGEKGGVGKSLTARLVAQYLIDHEHPFTGFDTDRSHGTFSRFYRDFTAQIVPSRFESLDSIIEVAEQHPEGNIVVDLAAQTASMLQKWFQDTDVVALFKELGFQVYWWHVMDDGADSAYLLDQLLTQYQHQGVRVVVVKNAGRGEDFALLEQSDIMEKALQSGADVIQISKLQPHLMQKIDFSNTSFWAAANNRNIMSLVERRRVKNWLEQNYLQLERVLIPQQQDQASPQLQIHISSTDQAANETPEA